MNFIEKKLSEKAKETELETLYSSWTYDKKLIPSAQQAIATIFPHYSLHDESHSLTIINNIVSILGQAVFDQFSCTDLWFILEAAYWHDIGMIVDCINRQNRYCA